MNLYYKNKERINTAVRLAPELQRYLDEQVKMCGEFGELLGDKAKLEQIDVVGKVCHSKKIFSPCDIVWNNIETAERRGANGKDARSKVVADKYEKEVLKMAFKKE
jgi:hypothetical protein